jgi:hypothetical protein
VTSFHHQPEAQHPKFFSYQQAAGRLPHLSGLKRTSPFRVAMSAFDPKATSAIPCNAHRVMRRSKPSSPIASSAMIIPIRPTTMVIPIAATTMVITIATTCDGGNSNAADNAPVQSQSRQVSGHRQERQGECGHRKAARRHGLVRRRTRASLGADQPITELLMKRIIAAVILSALAAGPAYAQRCGLLG